MVKRGLDEADQRSGAANLATHFAYVTVAFGAADTDTVVEHPLRPGRQEDIGYLVVQASAACRVYHDTSSTRREWPQGQIILRCDTASARVQLLLLVPAALPTPL